MSTTKMVMILLATSSGVGACAHVKGATQVGGEGAATWVYIESSVDANNGVYRCTQPPEGRPVCVRARVDNSGDAGRAVAGGAVTMPAVGEGHDDAPGEETAAAVRFRAAKATRALTESAQEAARAGDCATVRALDVRVRATDAHFHDTVFVRDVAIAACLAQPAAAVPTAP